MSQEIIRKESFCDLSSDEIQLIKNTVCKGASDEELKLFLHVCVKTGLNPFMKQIYSVPRGGQRTIQVGIDGYRLIAERTNRYAPGREPIFTYDSNGTLLSATAYIKKQTPDSSWHEVSATAFMNEYRVDSPFWKKMPHAQLSKCAESLALRKAFPSELSGIYTQEEMEQADKTIETISKEEVTIDPEIEEMKFESFLENFDGIDHSLIRRYLEVYCGVYKKSIDEFLKIYNSKDKFLEDFNKWKAKKLAKESKVA